MFLCIKLNIVCDIPPLFKKGGLFFLYIIFFIGKSIYADNIVLENENVFSLLDTISSYYDSIFSIKAKIVMKSSIVDPKYTVEGFLYFYKEKGFIYKIYAPSKIFFGKINDTIFLYNLKDSILYINTEKQSKFFKKFSKIYDIRGYNFYKVLKKIYICKPTHIFDNEILIKCFVENPHYIKSIYLKIDPNYKTYKSLEIYSLNGYTIQAVYLEDPIKRGKFALNTTIINSRMISKGFMVSDTIFLKRVIYNKESIKNYFSLPNAKKIKVLDKKTIEKQLKRKLK